MNKDASPDDTEDYVRLSTEDLTQEIVYLVIHAIRMWTDDDIVRMNETNGDLLIKEGMAKRILEVNQAAEELLKLMTERGSEIPANAGE